MRPVTQSFLNTVRGPHKAVFRARAVQPWSIGVTPTTLASAPLDTISGSVTFDVDSDVNGTLDITMNTPFDSVSPYSSEMLIERGVQYANGITEYVSLGYYRVNSVTQNRIPNGTISVSGEDRSCYLRDARLVSPLQFGSGASVASVITFLVQDVMPTVPVLFDTTNWPGGTASTTLLGSDHIVDEDRLGFIQQLVAAYGKVSYFDYAGRYVVKDAPSPMGAAVFTVNTGQNGVLVEASRTISRDGVYNAVVASGEPAGENPPVFAVAVDEVVGSPTFYGGPFGKVPKFFTSSFLVTSDQCLNTARAFLAAQHGLPYSVSLGLVPNPALEAWDVIQVAYGEGLNESHIIDTITYPLSVDETMKISTRKQFTN